MNEKTVQKRETPIKIEPGFSIYLDLVRVVAALDVMIAHAQLSKLIPPLPFILDSAPTAVVVFFVLSGYIIESTSQGGGIRNYAIHRTARIYSVALPAVILSLVCIAGYALAKGSAVTGAFLEQWGQWWRIPIILTFRGQDWFAEVELPWNGPFWSLHFEVAYYIIYGLLLLPGTRMRTFALLFFCLLIGPKILLLFPCWWLGVEIARRPSLRFPTRAMALTVFLVTPLIIATMVHFKLGPLYRFALEGRFSWYHLLGHAEPFPVRYVVAALVGANFVAARQLEGALGRSFGSSGSFIRWIAGYTFSIYLFHRPLQQLVGRFYTAQKDDLLLTVLVQLGILAAIFLIGSITERRTRQWREAVTRWVDRWALKSAS
jgi:peptidoglycan/LPS O-acetylase OafA/YrhL